MTIAPESCSRPGPISLASEQYPVPSHEMTPRVSISVCSDHGGHGAEVDVQLDPGNHDVVLHGLVGHLAGQPGVQHLPGHHKGQATDHLHFTVIANNFH